MDHFPPPPPRHPLARERMNIQKSSVCSRAYFVVVMAFFHIYIINIIALLLYVHYNTGPGEQDVLLEKSASVPGPMPEHQTPSPNLSPELSFQLPRLEGIRVSYMRALFTMLYDFFCNAISNGSFLKRERTGSIVIYFSCSVKAFIYLSVKSMYCEIHCSKK